MKLKYTVLVVKPLEFDDDQNRTQIAARALEALGQWQVRGAKIAVGKGGKRLPALGRSGPRIVFISGVVEPSQLLSLVQKVHSRGLKPIVVVDALQLPSTSTVDELHEALTLLNERSFQLCHIGEVGSLLQLGWNDLHMHRFAKADNTSSVAVFLEGGKKTLAIKRKRNPDAGKWALPGGFLNCQLETLEQCGAREVGEETKVRVHWSELVLVDVRSSPRRDSRQHVVDHGYAWFVPEEREAEIYANMEAADDAEKLEIVETDWLLQQDIAFDHRLIIERALAGGLGP